tara:strand:- start:4211 stop:4609 length:399 start_codon:yes stop_codon:yes gene_type:complete
MKVEVISTEGLDKKTIEKIESPMTFNQWWFENETTFVEIQNSKGEIIRVFPERIIPSLKEVSSEDLRQELKLRGYQTDNLWQVDDVMQNYDCESEEAQEVLIKALDNEATMEQVYLAIDIIADEVFNLKKKS